MFEYTEENTPEIPKDAMVIRQDARAYGAVTALTHRASPNSWDAFKGGRVRGFADLESDIDTVKCYNIKDPENVTIRDVSSFRKGSKGRAKATTQDEANKAADLQAHNTPDVVRSGITLSIGEDFS